MENLWITGDISHGLSWVIVSDKWPCTLFLKRNTTFLYPFLPVTLGQGQWLRVMKFFRNGLGNNLQKTSISLLWGNGEEFWNGVFGTLFPRPFPTPGKINSEKLRFFWGRVQNMIAPLPTCTWYMRLVNTSRCHKLIFIPSNLIQKEYFSRVVHRRKWGVSRIQKKGINIEHHTVWCKGTDV